MAIAVRLRQETIRSTKAIAGRMRLGTSISANARMHKALKGPVPPASGQGGFGV
jgi:hypothetical protein